jgi:hypothetical protein
MKLSPATTKSNNQFSVNLAILHHIPQLQYKVEQVKFTLLTDARQKSRA